MTNEEYRNLKVGDVCIVTNTEHWNRWNATQRKRFIGTKMEVVETGEHVYFRFLDRTSLPSDLGEHEIESFPLAHWNAEDSLSIVRNVASMEDFKTNVVSKYRY